MIYDTTALMSLAYTATQAMLDRKPVKMVHAPGYERHGFPLPIDVRRREDLPDGSHSQEYRPLGLLEFVDDCLAGKVKGQKP